MAQAEQATAVLVDYIREVGSIRIRSIGPDPFQRLDIRATVSAVDLETKVAAYWEFVDRAIKAGQLTQQEKSGLLPFYDDLVTEGAKLCKLIFSREARRQVWGLARQSSVITIITELMYVPWEALFDGDSNSFLSDHCVIVRWPESPVDNESFQSSAFERQRIVCLDPIIADDPQLEIDGSSIQEFLRAHFGDDLILTTMKSALVSSIKNTRVVQWICEHAAEGLRLSDEVFYTSDDSVAHRFPAGSTLILTSCKSAVANGSLASVASAICSSSQCTVVAPSSVVATIVGVRFAKTLDRILSERSPGMSVTDLWRSILVSHSDIQRDRNNLTAESCFARWYGIYGNGRANVT